MCILAVAEAGAVFSRDILEDMFFANSDGAGWAYAKNGKIYFSKGYTSVNKFIKAVQKMPSSVARMVHCRIATHGGVSKPLTHPFPISRSYAKMEALSGTMSSGYILAHNGILSNFTPDASHSDTEELVRCLANIKCDIMGEDMREAINAMVAGSRVAILNTDGKINRYGAGWSYDGGIWYSNTYFKYTARKYSSYAYGWDDDYYYSPPKKTAEEKPKTDAIPDIKTLDPLLAGEVIKNTETKRAVINMTDGSYLMDPKSGKLYGMYRDTLYTTKSVVCETYNCGVCNYDCPFKERGA